MALKKPDPFVRSSKALSLFDKAVSELRIAADDHYSIAGEADRQIAELIELRRNNEVAAADAVRRADKIGEFLA